MHQKRLSYFLLSWKETKAMILSKSGKDLKFPRNLHPTHLLPMTGRLFEKPNLKIFQRHTEERKLLNGGQFDFPALHDMTVQAVRLMAHVTLNVNNNTDRTAAVFLDMCKKPLTLPGTLVCCVSDQN
jgi:hypothetical protein